MLLVPNNMRGVSRDGLVLWLDESISGKVDPLGTWRDKSGYGNHCDLKGDAYVDELGSHFDGDGDYGEVADASDLKPGSLTLTVWVKLPTGGDRGGIAGTMKNDYKQGYHIWWDGDGNDLVFRAGKPYIDIRYADPKTDEWLFLAFTKDSSDNWEAFINTQSVGTMSTAPAYNDDPLVIGYFISSGYELNGSIAAVRIYNRALSAAEINALYLSNWRAYA